MLLVISIVKGGWGLKVSNTKRRLYDEEVLADDIDVRTDLSPLSW